MAKMEKFTCDKCEKSSDNLVKVHIRTGKRGRPPIKFYCADCLATPEVIIPGDKRQTEIATTNGAKIKILAGFDPAAIFLLTDVSWENLFEPCGDPFKVRCKGCRDSLRLSERKEHHKSHLAALRG